MSLYTLPLQLPRSLKNPHNDVVATLYWYIIVMVGVLRFQHSYTNPDIDIKLN